MSDIVERLRAHADQLDWTGAETAAREREAADEIERQRASAEYWRGEAVRAADTLPPLRAEIERLTTEKDEAYRQRNHLVAALAHLFPSGSGIRATNIDGWEPDWHGCVYVDLPTGQISYHYHDSQAGLFADLPSYAKPWDGHDKDAVHSRLAALESKT